MNRLQIVNRALAKLGQDPVSSLNSSEKRLKTALTLFDSVRDELMQVYPWNFCTHREYWNPAKIKDENGEEVLLTPAFGFKYQYRLPKDFLRLLECAELNYLWCGDCREPVLEGGYLLANHGGPLKVIYSRIVPEEQKWNPLFVNAFCCKLAFELCPNVEQSKADKAGLYQEFTAAIAAARRVNAMQEASMELNSTEYEDSRWL